MSAQAAASTGPISTRRSRGVSGVTNVLLGPDLVAQGQASGPFFNFDRDESGFAPDFQAGYTLPFAGGAWQAGLKFTYKLANIDSKENVSIPQEGSFTTIVGPPITIDFPGFVPITPAKIELKHQFVLCPRSAARSARSRSVPAVAPHCSTSR